MSETDREPERSVLRKRFGRCPKISSLENSNEIFTLLQVDPRYDDNLRIVDSEGDLAIIHFIDDIPELFHVQGVIVDVDYPRIVSKTFPYAQEIVRDKPLIEYLNSECDYLITECLEGTILRIFKFKGEWFIATHKHLNGGQCRWYGPKFGDQLSETLFASGIVSEEGTNPVGAMLKELDEVSDLVTYIFQMRTQYNTLVERVSNPELILLGVFEPDENIMWRTKLPILTFARHFKQIDRSELDSVQRNTPFTNDRYIVHDIKAGTFIKYSPSTYVESRELCGKHNNRIVRYLELASDCDDTTDMLERFVDFLKAEKTYRSVVDAVSYISSQLVEKNIRSDYNYRYSKGKYLWKPPVYHRFLEKAKQDLDVPLKELFERLSPFEKYQIYSCISF